MIAAVSRSRAFVAVRLLPSMKRLAGIEPHQSMGVAAGGLHDGYPTIDRSQQCPLLRRRERRVGSKAFGHDAGKRIVFLQHVDTGLDSAIRCGIELPAVVVPVIAFHEDHFRDGRWHQLSVGGLHGDGDACERTWRRSRPSTVVGNTVIRTSDCQVCLRVGTLVMNGPAVIEPRMPP